MIDGLKPYPAMKDSGVPWLGAVPEHWRVERLKSSMTNVIEQAAQRQSDDMYVALEHVESWTGLVRPADSGVAFDSQVKRFRAGDILFGKLRPYLAKVTRPTSDGVCVGEFLVLRPRRPDGFAPYLEQLLRSKPVIDSVNSSTFGAKMPRADWQFVGGMPIPLPPLPEQAAIVRFLDHADRRIRRYIRAKQKLIKLLEEQKQAIIHRAVTRGLDPNVRLKPSGVEWLGDVPEHWEELPLKRVSRLDNSGNYGVEPEQGEEVLPVATTAQIDRDGRFDVARMPRRGFSRAEVGRYGCRPGDILVVKSSGSIFNVISGKAGIVRSDTPRFIFSNFLMRIVADPAAIEPEYLFLLLSGYLTRERVKRMVAGTTYPNLRVGEYMSALVPVPPISEQRSITSAVSMMTTAVDHAVRSARTEIDLLREYRTRLIADVVTGKLDVREAAARLPDEAEEPEPLDEIEAEGDADDAGVGDADEMIEEAET